MRPVVVCSIDVGFAKKVLNSKNMRTKAKIVQQPDKVRVSLFSNRFLFGNKFMFLLYIDKCPF